MIGSFLKLFQVLGTRSVQVWEWRKEDVLKLRLPNNPIWSNFASQRPPLYFSGWQLAHAVIKGDFFTTNNTFLPRLGFLLQSYPVLALNHNPNFRVKDNIASIVSDFVFTSLSGRTAQGIAILFATERKYIFTGHLAAYAAHSNGVPTADFIFESPSGDRMILESKGSFSLTTNDPTMVKRTLKKSLENQVYPSLAKISPHATQGFAAYTCIREESGGVDSAIIFVDPPGEPGGELIEIGKSWVRRRNYAAWLNAMGLPGPAERLRDSRGAVPRLLNMPIISVMGQRIAVMLTSAPETNFGFYGLGIEVKAINAIAEAIRGHEADLVNYKGIDGLGPDATHRRPEDSSGSLMPDGTFLGHVALNDIMGWNQYEL